jgi:hypothetical protein
LKSSITLINGYIFENYSSRSVFYDWSARIRTFDISSFSCFLSTNNFDSHHNLMLIIFKQFLKLPSTKLPHQFYLYLRTVGKLVDPNMLSFLSEGLTLIVKLIGEWKLLKALISKPEPFKLLLDKLISRGINNLV